MSIPKELTNIFESIEEHKEGTVLIRFDLSLDHAIETIQFVKKLLNR